MNLSSIRDPVLQLPAPGMTLVSETGQLALESSSKEQTDRQESSRPEVDALRAHSHSPEPVKWAQQGSISLLSTDEGDEARGRGKNQLDVLCTVHWEAPKMCVLMETISA